MNERDRTRISSSSSSDGRPSFESITHDAPRHPAAFAPAQADQKLAPLRPAAQTARLAVAAGHFGELLVPGMRLGRLPYLDDEGCAVVLVPRERMLPTGQVGFQIAVPNVGQVALIGQFGDFPLPMDQARRVGELLMTHRMCLSGKLDRAGATPRAMRIDSVLLDTGLGAGPETAPPEIVTPAAYAEATLDLFAALGPALATHVTRVHQDMLLALVQRCGLASDPLAVALRVVAAGGMRLELFEATGSRPVRLRFSHPLGHPHEIAAALHTMTERPS
jgi:hypothetical protein